MTIFNPLRFCGPLVSSPEDRHQRVQAAAYARAVGRRFESGNELEDWYAAELEVDAQIAMEALHPPV